MTKIIFSKSRKACALILSVFTLSCGTLWAQDVSTEKAASLRQSMVNEAKKYVGCPYVLGATGPDSFDCSGLIYYVSREATKKQLPRTARAIHNFVEPVSDSNREAGDLVFFQVNGTINHVGIYIGNNQFISAVSDGPNTGVILSSLTENYWKTHYASAGSFLPSSKRKSHVAKADVDDRIAMLDEKSADEKRSSGPRRNPGSGSNENGFLGFLEEVSVDGTIFCDWSFVLPNNFIPNFRGVDVMLGATYEGLAIAPGISMAFRYNSAMDVIQMPITFSLNFNDYMKFYVGPVVTFGEPKPYFVRNKYDANGNLLPADISASFFPGVIGLSFSTPNLLNSDWRLQLVHDMSLTIYNKPDGSALNFGKTLNAGFVMYTGIKVTFPLNMWL